MFKSLLTNVFAATVALFPIASASAANTTDPLAKWVAQVNKQIDARAQAPITGATGIARVAFRRSPDGHAVDISAQSNRSAVAKAGIRTVRLLRDLPPLPAGLPADQRIVMNFLVGGPGTPVPFEIQRERLLASGTAHNATLASTLNGEKVALLGRQ